MKLENIYPQNFIFVGQLQNKSNIQVNIHILSTFKIRNQLIHVKTANLSCTYSNENQPRCQKLEFSRNKFFSLIVEDKPESLNITVHLKENESF